MAQEPPACTLYAKCERVVAASAVSELYKLGKAVESSWLVEKGVMCA